MMIDPNFEKYGEIDSKITEARWRWLDAELVGDPLAASAAKAKCDRLLDRRLTLGGTHAGATPPPRHTTTL